MVKDLVCASDCPRRVGTIDQFHRHSCLDPSLFPDAKIPACSAIANHERDQFVHPPSPRKLPARLSRLARFEKNWPNPRDVSDTDGLFAQAGYRKIFAKGAMRHMGQMQALAPLRIMFSAVGKNSFIDAAVMLRVGLAVALDICRADKRSSLDRPLIESCSPGLIVRIGRILNAMACGQTHLD